MTRRATAAPCLLLFALVVALVTVAPGQAAARKTSRVSGWSGGQVTAVVGEVVELRLRVRPATRPRAVVLQRKASGERSWSSAVRGRTTRTGAVVLRVPTASVYDGSIRLRVAAAPRARSLTTRPRGLVVQRQADVSTAPPPATTPPADTAATALEQEVLTLVNEARKVARDCGSERFAAVGALRMDDRLSRASRDHARDMGEKAYFSHNSADGRSPWDRSRAAGYDSAGGENIAAGYRTAKSVVDGWLASAGHCRNIMAAGMVHLGVGFAEVPGSPYGTYWVQMFGRG